MGSEMCIRDSTSDTDTEILAHLIEEYYDGDLLEATQAALSQVEGTYGIAVVCKDNPHQIVAARHGSPLIIGTGKGENFVASDIAAILRHTNRVVYLEDREVALVDPDNFIISTVDKTEVTPQIQEISWTLDQIEKGGFPHFMLKEIFEQPTTLRNAIRGRLNYEEGTSRLNGLNLQYEELHLIDRIILSACGTAWHAALVGEYMIEGAALIPVEVEYASEFRYRSPIINEGTIVFVISQSGETADTLAAVRQAKSKGARTLTICNVVGSSIVRESDSVIYTLAGPEIGVASTKAYTAQLLTLYLFALRLASLNNRVSLRTRNSFIKALRRIPSLCETILKSHKSINTVARRHSHFGCFLFLGRNINFPTALEGALKLKEISYIPAEGYAAGEMKHGPIALIDEYRAVVCIVPYSKTYEKMVSNIQEIRSRKGKVIAISTLNNNQIKDYTDEIIYIPRIEEIFSPLLTIIPLQLIAYYIAVNRKCDVDQPRNLAKSVTVE